MPLAINEAAWTATLPSGDNPGMPRIPEFMLNSIVFLYPSVEHAKRHARVGGTGFVVTHPLPKASKAAGMDLKCPFIVTNRHVVANDGACVPRINSASTTWKILDLTPDQWSWHPTDDLAVISVFAHFNSVEDHLSAAPWELLIMEDKAKGTDIGIGDEVFMIGRFINHQGRDSIEPAVRFGSISKGPAPIYNKTIGRDQLSYAVEMRSKAGFSGAPVILYRTPHTTLKVLPEGSEAIWGVLGVNWGYIYDDDGENTWLNGVVPAWRVRDFIASDLRLQQSLQTADDVLTDMVESGAIPSGAGSEPPTKVGNPQHKEDFRRLLDAASRKPRQGGQT